MVMRWIPSSAKGILDALIHKISSDNERKNVAKADSTTQTKRDFALVLPSTEPKAGETKLQERLAACESFRMFQCSRIRLGDPQAHETRGAES